METFRGKGHLPGTDRERDIGVEIDWKTKEVSVHIEGVAEGVTDWPGLVPQTFGPMDELSSAPRVYHAFSPTGGTLCEVAAVGYGE